MNTVDKHFGIHITLRGCDNCKTVWCELGLWAKIETKACFPLSSSQFHVDIDVFLAPVCPYVCRRVYRIYDCSNVWYYFDPTSEENTLCSCLAKGQLLWLHVMYGLIENLLVRHAWLIAVSWLYQMTFQSWNTNTFQRASCFFAWP